MCTMNYWCSITTICIILIVALVLTNSVNVHVTHKHDGKPEQQLDDFRKEAYRAKKDLGVFEKFAEFQEKHGKRQKRHAEDLFETLDDEIDKEKFDEEALQSNCNPNICKARNCAGGICRAGSPKTSSNKLNNFFKNLKLQSKNMPREISLEETEPETDTDEAIGAKNAQALGRKSLSDIERNGMQEDEELGVENLRKEESSERLKLKSGIQNDLRWLQSAEKSEFRGAANLNENSNFVKENQVDSDLSSCQQCSQNKPKDITNPCKPHKEPQPVVSYENIQFQEPEKTEQDQSILNNFERKFHKQKLTDAASDDDDEDDKLYHVESRKFSPYQRKNDINQYNFQQPSVEISKRPENSALNDQLEVTKNNLSHEADYKLSKDEQNASENKKYASWKWGLFKRSYPFNAMHEIKLKTSQRLMKKGFGASLPSYSLAEIRRDLFIDNKLRQREKEIFHSNNRKYKHFDETDTMANSFRETKNQFNDLAEMPLGPDLEPLPLNDWSRTRHKRISDVITRSKRSLKVYNEPSSTEAFKYANKAKSQNLSRFQNQNIKVKALRPKTVKSLEATSKAFKAKTYAKHNFSKAFIKNFNENTHKEIQKKSGRKLDKKYFAPKTGYTYKAKNLIKQDKGNESSAKALSFRYNVTRNMQAKKSLYNEKLILDLQLPQTFLENTTKAFKVDKALYNKAEFNRVEGAILSPTLEQQIMNTQRKNAETSFNISSFNKLKRTKRFNPCQTIALKLYQKHHRGRTLNMKKHRRVFTPMNKRLEKVRYRRSLDSQTCATSSAGQQSLIKKTAKALMSKVIQFQKNIGNFIKKSIKYFTFQKASFKKPSQAFSTEGTVFNSNEVLILNETKLNDKSRSPESKTFKLIEKSLPKVAVKREAKNPKLRFFEKLFSQLCISKQYLKSLKRENTTKLAEPRARRRARSLTNNQAKMQQNSNFSHKLESFVKTFFNTAFDKKSPEDFVKQVEKANSDSALEMADGDSITAKSSVGNLNENLKHEQNTPQKLSTTSSSIDDNVSDNDKQHSKHNQASFKHKFNRSLRLNKSFDNKILKEQILESANNANNLNLSQTLFHMTNKSRKNSLTRLKRFKRSLEAATQEDHGKAQAVNHMKKRSSFYPYVDFYRPSNKPDTSMKIPSKLDFNIDNSQKLLTNEIVPARQEINFENYYDTFSNKKFDDLKNYNPQEKKFDNLQFDNVWLENEAQNANFKQQKRNLNNLDKKGTNTLPRNFRIPFKRNGAFKTHKLPHIATKSPSKVNILKDEYLKDLQNFNKNYKFKANNFNWTENNANSATNCNDNNTDYSEKFGLEMHNEILNCKAFASLEDFIKSLPKNLTQPPLQSGNSCTTETIKMDLSTLSVRPELTTTPRPFILESTESFSTKAQEECNNNKENPETTTEISEDDLEQTSEFEPYPNEEESEEETTLKPMEEDNSEETVPPNTSEGQDVKLNISINALLQANTNDRHYCGNGTFRVTPAVLDDRLRRDLNLSPLEKIPNPFLRTASLEAKEEEKEDLSDLMSGKFSATAVKDVLNAVQGHPQLRVLWPSLNPSHQNLATANHENFYAIRNQHTEPLLRSSEKLFAQTMSAINAIVEQQARAHLCVPLRPDLQEFYNMIVQARQHQAMVREKRQNEIGAKEPDASYQLQLVAPNKIEEKTKIVKKLLKQYEELSPEDQQQVAVVRDDLLKNLIILRQLQDNEERQANELREKREKDWAASDEAVLKSLQSQYSSQFLKLLKTAELYREIKND